MLQLHNTSPFVANFAIFPDARGIETLYVIVKATFENAPQWTISEPQMPVQEEDAYYGEPGQSSIRYPSDFHGSKPATDIIMLGSACGPDRTSTRQLRVSLQVGECQKAVHVFGKRIWENGVITPAEPFETLRLRYENAFGGQDIVDGNIRSAEFRNPVGTGFKGKQSSKSMNGVGLPNLETPGALIESLNDTPAPAAFGAIAPHWKPRSDFAGTYDETWQQTRAPYLPADFDLRFFNVAPADLQYTGFIQGGEPVEIIGMHPTGPLRFHLPNVALQCLATVESQTSPLPLKMQTVILEPNQLKVSLTWQAYMPVPKQIQRLKEIVVDLRK